MLSYRHAYHAGNQADIFKHFTLFHIVKYLLQKETPLSYLDTHAGAGLYRLDSEASSKTGEAQAGILSLLEAQSKLPLKTDSTQSFVGFCKTFLDKTGYYPGSPAIVASLLRSQDKLILMELHNNEIDILKHNLGADNRIHIHHRDGFTGLVALTPPTPRRGLCLLDPSYELPGDYASTAQAVLETARRWPAGILLVWYPVVGRRENQLKAMHHAICTSGLPVLDICVNSKNNVTEYGLAGSGILVVRPPWNIHHTLDLGIREILEILGLQEDTFLSSTLHGRSE